MKRISLLTFLLMWQIMSFLYAINTNSIETDNELQSWIGQNPQASTKELTEFLEVFIPTLPNVESTYSALTLIINRYPVKVIPYTIYLLFAQIASLKFDFATASLMYYTAYTLSNNFEYLYNATIQEFQLGNNKQVSEYLEILLKNKEKIAQSLLAKIYLLQSEIILLSDTPTQAYEFLDSSQYQLSENIITSGFLYQLYRLSILAENDNTSYLIHRAMVNNFPDSIETSLIDNESISPLPLPSLLFAIIPDSNINSQDNTSSPQNDNNNQITNKSQSLPEPSEPLNNTKIAYQVGAFSNIQYARNTLEYYKELWSELKIESPAPIISKKIVDGTTFYQIIFPLHANKETYHEQSAKLKSLGIEGFLINN